SWRGACNDAPSPRRTPDRRDESRAPQAGTRTEPAFCPTSPVTLAPQHQRIEMGISLKPEHVKRYRDIARLLFKYGRSDLVNTAGLDEALLPERSVATAAR